MIRRLRQHQGFGADEPVCSLGANEKLYWETKSRQWLARQPVIKYHIIKLLQHGNIRSWDRLEEPAAYTSMMSRPLGGSTVGENGACS